MPDTQCVLVACEYDDGCPVACRRVHRRTFDEIDEIDALIAQADGTDAGDE